jgi:hypothetical protein
MWPNPIDGQAPGGQYWGRKTWSSLTHNRGCQGVSKPSESKAMSFEIPEWQSIGQEVSLGNKSPEGASAGCQAPGSNNAGKSHRDKIPRVAIPV